MEETIKFYHVNKPYGFLSNFSAHPIDLKGKRWPTSEHYFQAMKFEGTEHEEAVRRATSPMDAAQMGRDRRRPLRGDWEAVKDDVMRAALRAKFTQHEDLMRELIGTGTAHLIEHTTNDAYWADGGDGTGRNMLGVLLMELRKMLQSHGP